jgi:uncharacterized protein YodC (DUF2158 family)
MKLEKTDPIFEIGDVVQLKSGSPHITIIELIAEIPQGKSVVTSPEFCGNCRCSWFEEGKMKKEVFHQKTLEKISVSS